MEETRVSIPPFQPQVASLTGPVFSVLAGDPSRSGFFPVHLQPFQRFYNEVPILLSSALHSFFFLTGLDWYVKESLSYWTW